MSRITAVLTMFMLMTLISMPVGADQLSAIEIFDGMIHYEGDQLYKKPAINDYRCHITETTARTGISAREIIEKDLYFMVPTFQLQLIDNKPAFYFDDDLLIVLLESVELERKNNQTIDEVECYQIRTIPKDPAYNRYNRTYFVAVDDFRHVRTIAHHSTREFDDLTTTIDYSYGQIEDFIMLTGTVARTSDENDNVLATVTTEYAHYEFGLGLDMEFFMNYVGDTEPQIPLN